MTCSRLAAGVSVLAALAVPVALAEGGGGASLIQPHFGTSFWTLVTFGILLLLLKKFAWKPLLGALEAREQSIEGSIEQAKKDREEAETLLTQQRDLVREARRERAEAFAVGQREAERLKTEILDEARNQKEQLLKQTEVQVEAVMRKARAELRGEAVDLALRAAQKLLAANLDEGTQRRLAEDYIEEFGRDASSSSLPS